MSVPESIPTADRVRGTLWGLAWGDVFGAPMEQWRQPEIARFFGGCTTLIAAWPPEARGLPPRRRKHLRPIGLHTDDTQQAMALIGACFEAAESTAPDAPAVGWSPRLWAEWLVEGFADDAWRGFGRNFLAAVHRLRKGTPPGEAGSATAGMGAAMRIGPVGALFRDDRSALVEVSMASSLMTHGDLRAGAIAFAVAYACAAFIRGQSAAAVRAALPGAVWAAEAAWIDRAGWTFARSGAHQVSAGLDAIFGHESLFTAGGDEPAALRAVISHTARPHLAEGFTRAHPNQGFALLGGAHALAMALRDDITPQATLSEIVRQGFDTDTVAAIAGAVLGARFGRGWIPRERLLDARRIEAYAEALVHRRSAPEDRADFFAAEAALTRREVLFRKDLLAERRTDG